MVCTAVRAIGGADFVPMARCSSLTAMGVFPETPMAILNPLASLRRGCIISHIGDSEGRYTVKHSGRYVGYYRVSTKSQGDSGLGIEGQKAALLTFLNGGNWSLVGEFTEIESGRDGGRPQLAAALAHCRLMGATLLIAKLDRLSRNMAFLANLMESKVPFVCCDNPHATRFTIHILAAVAEHEAEQISARTKAALAAAKARGTKLGGYRGGPVPDGALGVAALQARSKAFAARVRPTVEALRAEGKSLRQIAADLTQQGIPTPRPGGAWTASTVRRVIGA